MSAVWQASAGLLAHCWDSGQPGPSLFNGGVHGHSHSPVIRAHRSFV